MKPFLVSATAVLSLLVTVPEALGADAPPKKEPWICTVTRADSEGKVLSRASIPLSFWIEQAGCHGTVSINMGTADTPRLWDINFWSGLAREGALINFSVNDTTMLWSSTSDGTTSGGPTGMMETSTIWKGAGRYEIFALDDETVTAEFRPVESEGVAPGEHRPAKIIEIIRRDRSGVITGRASTAWNEKSEDKIVAELALHGGPKSQARMRTIRARFDEVEEAIAFRVRDVVSIGPGRLVNSLVVFDVWAPLKESGKYTICTLDGETLEAVIRDGD